MSFPTILHRSKNSYQEGVSQAQYAQALEVLKSVKHDLSTKDNQLSLAQAEVQRLSVQVKDLEHELQMREVKVERDTRREMENEWKLKEQAHQLEIINLKHDFLDQLRSKQVQLDKLEDEIRRAKDLEHHKFEKAYEERAESALLGMRIHEKNMDGLETFKMIQHQAKESQKMLSDFTGNDRRYYQPSIEQR
jgi:phage-related tail protein